LGNTGNLAKTGYVFSGWNTKADGSGTSYTGASSFAINANVALYATWVTPGGSTSGTTIIVTPPQYALTIQGSSSDAIGSTYTYSATYSGNPISYQWSLDTNPLAGATTKTWSWTPTSSQFGSHTLTLFITDSNGLVYSGSVIVTVGNSSTVVTYSVSYDGNGGSGTTPLDSGAYISGQTVTVEGNTGNLVKTGFAFGGWNSKSDGSGTSYSVGSTFLITANTTLFAVWTSIPTYSITYNANGASSGTVPLDTTAYPSGQSITVAGNTGNLSKTGYSFGGWNTQADGNGVTYSPLATITASANVNLWAIWVANSIGGQAGGTVTITNPPAYTVTLSGASTVQIGTSSTYSVSYSGSPKSYQWLLNGTSITGATSATYAFTPVTSNFGTDVLTLMIVDANGITYSGSYSITVTN
jgi:hypothetical protein